MSDDVDSLLDDLDAFDLSITNNTKKTNNTNNKFNSNSNSNQNFFQGSNNNSNSNKPSSSLLPKPPIGSKSQDKVKEIAIF